jgi:hypothetical protein
MWNTELTKMQRYYETLVTLRGGHAWEGKVKEGIQNLNMGDILSIQECI